MKLLLFVLLTLAASISTASPQSTGSPSDSVSKPATVQTASNEDCA